MALWQRNMMRVCHNISMWATHSIQVSLIFDKSSNMCMFLCCDWRVPDESKYHLSSNCPIAIDCSVSKHKLMNTIFLPYPLQWEYNLPMMKFCFWSRWWRATVCGLKSTVSRPKPFESYNVVNNPVLINSYPSFKKKDNFFRISWAYYRFYSRSQMNIFLIHQEFKYRACSNISTSLGGREHFFKLFTMSLQSLVSCNMCLTGSKLLSYHHQSGLAYLLKEPFSN